MAPLTPFATVQRSETFAVKAGMTGTTVAFESGGGVTVKPPFTLMTVDPV